MKGWLVTLLVASVVVPVVASRKRNAKAALRAAAGLFALFMLGYLVVLFVYPVFQGR